MFTQVVNHLLVTLRHHPHVQPQSRFLYYFLVLRDSSLNESQIMMRKSESRSVVSDSLRPHGLYSLWNSPGQNNGVGSLSILQGIFPTQGLNPGLPHCRWILYQLNHKVKSLSRVRLFGTPRTVAYQASLSIGFSRQEYWSGLPFPSAGDLPWPRNRTQVSCKGSPK